jgi:hypothetical protein
LDRSQTCTSSWRRRLDDFLAHHHPPLTPRSHRRCGCRDQRVQFGVIVAGNIPFLSQTAAVYVFGEVESENRLGASAVSIVMVAIAFGLLMFADYLRKHSKNSKREMA